MYECLPGRNCQCWSGNELQFANTFTWPSKDRLMDMRISILLSYWYYSFHSCKSTVQIRKEPDDCKLTSHSAVTVSLSPGRGNTICIIGCRNYSVQRHVNVSQLKNVSQPVRIFIREPWNFSHSDFMNPEKPQRHTWSKSMYKNYAIMSGKRDIWLAPNWR